MSVKGWPMAKHLKKKKMRPAQPQNKIIETSLGPPVTNHGELKLSLVKLLTNIPKLKFKIKINAKKILGLYLHINYNYGKEIQQPMYVRQL